VAGGRFAPGHVGELTRIVGFDMVDAVLSETGTVQRRVRDLPARVVVYLLLAAGLFAELGYGQVWSRMTAGLDGLEVAAPTAGALAQARRRIGVAPLRALFDLLRGPSAGLATKGVYWRGRLVCAIDGTMMCCPDTPANLRTYRRGGGHHGGTGYPMIRMLALLACGTRTIIDATFGSTSVGETTYTHDLDGSILSLVNHAPDGSVDSRFDYTYDHLEQRTGMTTLDGVWAYQYDPAGQLTHATFTSNNAGGVLNQDLLYFYDLAGNRTQTIINGVTTAYVANALNQYTQIGSAALTYDPDGNLITQTDTSGTTTNTYDQRNRLIDTSAPTNIYAFHYDSLGNLASMTHNGQTTHYVAYEQYAGELHRGASWF